MTRVVLPSQLFEYTRGAREVDADGATLGALLDDLDRRFPGLRFRVIDEQDRVRRHVILFVGERRVEDLATPIPAGATVHVVGALSGG